MIRGSKRRSGPIGFGALLTAGMIVAASIGWYAVWTFADSKSARESNLRFDGTRHLSHLVDGFYDTFTIDIWLRSSPIGQKPKSQARTAAPKAFLGGGLAILRGRETYEYYVAGQGIVAGGGQPERWQRTTLTVDPHGIARIFLNGKPIWSGTGGFDLQNSVIYLAGSGSEKAKWMGEVHKVVISDGVKFFAEFDPNSDPRVEYVRLADSLGNPNVPRPTIVD